MDMTSTAVVFEEYVCPTIGAIMSTLTFAAPIKSLKNSIKAGSLGDLNPTPWAFMTGNCIGWLAYSFITLDLFVFFANAPGLMISIWLNVGAMKLQYYEEIVKYSSVQLISAKNDDDDNGENERNFGNDTGDVQDLNRLSATSEENTKAVPCVSPSSLTSHEMMLTQIVIIWIGILSVASLTPVIKGDIKLVVGVAVNVNLIFFYAAPLSTIATVLRTKNSSSIHFWTMVMNTINAFFWCVYSFAIQDYYILIPNGLGFVFGVTQMILYACFRQKEDIKAGDGAEQFLDDAGHSRGDTEENEII
mmetsp:Transcript_26968/g.55758  ORF Transcript_26968/g.55758 Transcript_26968/m.55758 type:complete len:304 (+) Transcript_26968:63-974(+)